MSSLEPGGVVQYEGEPGRPRPVLALLLVALVVAAVAAVLEPYFVLDRIRDAAREGDSAKLRRWVEPAVLEGPFRTYLEASQPRPGVHVTRRFRDASTFVVTARADYGEPFDLSVTTTTTLTLRRRGLGWHLADVASSQRVDHDGMTVVPPPPQRGPDELPKYGEYVYVEVLPEVKARVAPDYPELARSAGVEGTVLVQALVGRDGLVRDVRVTKSVPMLDAAATAAVRRWTFEPAKAAGRPVAVWVAVPVRFRLR